MLILSSSNSPLELAAQTDKFQLKEKKGDAATSREFVVRAVVENKRYWSGTLLLLLGTAISIVIAFYWTRLRGLVGARFAGI